VDDVLVVDVVPSTHSNEVNQDSEPSVAVNSENPDEIVVTAFTPADPGETNSPIYCSIDSGLTWQLNFDVPFGLTSGPGLKTPGDQSVAFAAGGSELFGAFLRLDNSDLNVFRTADPTAPGAVPTFDDRSNIDQPWVEARKVVGGPDDGKLRLYVGYNDDGTETGPSATVDVCLDALAPTPAFTQVLLEQRTVGAGLRDGYAIRPVAHADGTIYVAYERWSGGAFRQNITADIVVARDDSWGGSASPFTDLIDSSDGLPGRLVATGVTIDDGGFLGPERLNNDLAIAVDPNHSDVVYVAWSDNTEQVYTLRVRRSTNRGVDWSDDLLTVPNATMAGLAINSAGRVALMYQSVENGRWETHLRRTANSEATAWDDLVLSNTPVDAPKLDFHPYLGDWARLVALGRTFYGVFCANNTPDPANFPSGVRFQRNHTTSPPFTLLTSEGGKPVRPSIDPFFFRVRETAPPRVLSIAPHFGPEAGGTTVTITGEGLTGATEIRFGSVSTTSFVVDSDTQITVVSPPGTGTVHVVVVTPDGESTPTPADEFTYIPPDSGGTVTPPGPPQAPAPPPTVTPAAPAPVAPRPPVPQAPGPQLPTTTPPAIAPPAGEPPTTPSALAPCPSCGECCCCAAITASVANVATTAVTAITAIAAIAQQRREGQSQ
jgi:IPT/TIG domain